MSLAILILSEQPLVICPFLCPPLHPSYTLLSCLLSYTFSLVCYSPLTSPLFCDHFFTTPHLHEDSLLSLLLFQSDTETRLTAHKDGIRGNKQSTGVTGLGGVGQQIPHALGDHPLLRKF